MHFEKVVVLLEVHAQAKVANGMEESSIPFKLWVHLWVFEILHRKPLCELSMRTGIFFKEFRLVFQGLESIFQFIQFETCNAEVVTQYLLG